MDRINNYRQIIREFLQDFATDGRHKPLNSIQGTRPYDPEAQLIFDLERDRYLVLHSGWRNDYRIYGCAIHLDLIDNKVWIQNNSTEVYVDRELVKRGVERKDIVLGFRSPSIREKIASALGDY